MWGGWGACEAMKTGLLHLQDSGLGINFNQRAFAGFITPCVVVWDRSGSLCPDTVVPALKTLIILIKSTPRCKDNIFS